MLIINRSATPPLPNLPTPSRATPSLQACPACQADAVTDGHTTVPNEWKKAFGYFSLIQLVLGLGVILALRSEGGKDWFAILGYIGWLPFFFGITLGVFFLCIPNNKVVGIHRRCLTCSHRWMV